MRPWYCLLGLGLVSIGFFACSASSESDSFEEGTQAGAGAGTGQGGELAIGGAGGGLGVGGGTPGPVCKVSDQAPDALPPCVEKAPPDAFSPVTQWEWTAPPNG